MPWGVTMPEKAVPRRNPAGGFRRLASSGRLLLLAVAAITPGVASAANPKKAADLWALRPLVSPEVPTGVTTSTNGIDAFLAAEHQAKGLRVAGPADPQVLLRRVHLDLTGIPPTPEEQAAFAADHSPAAYGKVVDDLLADEQHAVRYARHWLDVLRYTDVDERMTAAPGLHLWRDWVIRALDEDIPYDGFVRAQLTGNRAAVRTEMSATGVRHPVEPRPDDMFALGFLARGAVAGPQESQELALAAVETVSTAFMGMTVGCARCHDHMFDPILKRDFYAMKALFDPLVLRRITLAPASEILAAGRAFAEREQKRAPVQKELNELVAPYKRRLYDERVTMLPPDVQLIIRKPEKARTAAEQKIADDYFPILRIDSDKIDAVMPEADRKRHHELDKRLNAAGEGLKHGVSVPAFWTVEADHGREVQPSYELTSGDPDRPETNHVARPGWPFAPASIEFREGRVETFADWLTAPANPLFARVAVNRLWQWHFGEGLQSTPSDFGSLGGRPSNPALLDWLASEFVRCGFSMKKMHRLMVTSEAYQRASDPDSPLMADNARLDPANACLWRFRLQRLDAEAIWDSIFSAAGALDPAVGGPSFDPQAAATRAGKVRRAAYLTRGYSPSREAMTGFLTAFDVDDGRSPCPLRSQTVTAPQSLFLMNSPEIDQASGRFAELLKAETGADLGAAVTLGYRKTLGRSPTSAERDRALAYLGEDPGRLKGLSWLLFNLDEFVYVR